MSDRVRPSTGVLMAVLVACAVTAMTAGVVAVERASARRASAAESAALAKVAEPSLGGLTSAATGVLTPPPDSLPAEADVFRLPPDAMAIEPDARRERRAHPRKLTTYHYLRAYPGAPPRIPHGLTPEEFRTGACKTCHELGGYSERFAAYVPVTPHPEMGFCLQCHVGDDRVTGIQHPSADPNARCRQCHTPSGPPRRDLNATLNWPAPEWPRLPALLPGREPPPIPHELQTRGNCLACHAGPAAVAEIRTKHPEDRDCLQCHVAGAGDSAVFTRPGPEPGSQSGGLR